MRFFAISIDHVWIRSSKHRYLTLYMNTCTNKASKMNINAVAKMSVERSCMSTFTGS